MPLRIPKDWSKDASFSHFQDRDPKVDEAAAYLEWLRVEIEVVKAWLEAHRQPPAKAKRVRKAKVTVTPTEN